MSLARDLARGLLQLLYPGVCVVCDDALETEALPFCAACRSALLRDPHAACPRCAATVGPFVSLAAGCTHCRDARFHFEGVRRLGPYEGIRRDVILRLKQSTGEGLAEHLGALWAEHARAALQALSAELIVPVPLHWWRRWQRGYNQSEVLADALARSLRLPCLRGELRRVRPTPQQTRQTPSGRRDNVRGAFRARPGSPVRGKAILLVDDVLTTGSTCSEAARALREAGAARVCVAVLARSIS